MTFHPSANRTNAGLDPRRWQQLKAERDDLDVSPSLFDDGLDHPEFARRDDVRKHADGRRKTAHVQGVTPVGGARRHAAH